MAITAAMPDGTGLDRFQKVFPDRMLDVGIAEQHAVTLAGGLSLGGLKPVVAIYSTFLQRAYDQVIHDICLQNLDVTFGVDRGGLVGDDGPTHHGVFDMAYLRTVPNAVLMAAKDEAELRDMVKTALDYPGPAFVRYPRGQGVGVSLDRPPQGLPLGKAELVREGADIGIIAVGPMVYTALEAAERLTGHGIDAAVLNLRFIKPIDVEAIVELALATRRIITIEEGSLAGGVGSAVLEVLADRGITDVRVTRLGVGDEFIEHGSVSKLRELCGLTASHLVDAALTLTGNTAQNLALGEEWLEKVRLDALLVTRGLVDTRTRARQAIIEGKIAVDGEVQLRPGVRVDPGALISVVSPLMHYVSRGALKLQAALDGFGIAVAGRVALDVGASTGGFTQLLLERGAARVYAVDVGRGQLHDILRSDPRRSMEDTDIRQLRAGCSPRPSP